MEMHLKMNESCECVVLMWFELRLRGREIKILINEDKQHFNEKTFSWFFSYLNGPPGRILLAECINIA